MTDNINKLFDDVREAIGEEEIARVALEYWLEVDKHRELPMTEAWHLPMLAFQLGYAYCKERYKLDE